MRHPKRALADAQAIELMGKIPTVQLATTTPDGRVVLRSLHAVVVGDFVAFHGAVAGEKAGCLGREAVVAAERTLASIPSYFVDPERACPATTYYQSVQVRGRLEKIEGMEEKAAVLRALMEKYQPERGYVDIDPKDPRYTKSIRGILIFGVRIEELCGKHNIGQHRSDDEMGVIASRLWERGDEGDLETLDLLRAHRPGLLPSLAPTLSSEYFLHTQMPTRHAEAVADLLEGSYWNRGVSRSEIIAVHRAAQAWMGIVDANGHVLASARALADGAKFGWILDVIVAPAMRGQGLGAILMRALLAHPKIRCTRRVGLATKDAERFYEGLGFVRDQWDGSHEHWRMSRALTS